MECQPERPGGKEEERLCGSSRRSLEGKSGQEREREGDGRRSRR